MIGKTLGHYQITEKLGEGGMGEVYLAEDTSLKRRVALKFLPAYLQQDEVTQKRFLREARLAAALDHPFICHIHEIGEAEGRNFIAMEYIKGQTLKERLLEGPVPLKQATQIGMEVAEALEEAHKAGIAHRDLKPANIMLTSGGHVKVMDFGLAKKVVDEDGTEQDTTSALTREGTTLGTLAYMSPEQLRTEPVDTRTDIFSFGIVLYELLAGVHPFRRPLQAETTNAILHDIPPPLKRFTDDTADLLQHTMDKMMEKDPEDRYQTIHEVRSNLKKLLERLSGPERVPSQVKTKRRIWLGTSVSLMVLAALVLAVYLYQPSPAPLPVAPIDSIAILPFRDEIGGTEAEHLSRGIAEGVTHKLAGLPDLRVIPSSNLTRYLTQEFSAQTVAKELRVQAVLLGELRKIGEWVSVSVELVDAKADRVLWGTNYRLTLEDLFDVEAQIVAEVSRALKYELAPARQGQPAAPETKSSKAHEAYLKGLFQSQDERNAEGQRRAIAYFEKAIAEDPGYAEAYLRLGESYNLLGWYSTSKEAYQKARQAFATALRLQPTLAEAQWALAEYDQNWGVMQEVYKEIPESRLGLSGWIYLLWQARREEALQAIKRAADRSDPLSGGQQHLIGWGYYIARDYVQALRCAEEAIRVGSPSGYFTRSISLLALGQEEEAFQSYVTTLTSGGGSYYARSATETELEELRRAYAESGMKGYGQAVLRERLLAKPYDRAGAYALIGNADMAFKCLEETYEAPGLGAPFVADARFDSLRGDPRYKKLLRKLNLPEEAIQRHLALLSH